MSVQNIQAWFRQLQGVAQVMLRSAGMQGVAQVMPAGLGGTGIEGNR